MRKTLFIVVVKSGQGTDRGKDPTIEDVAKLAKAGSNFDQMFRAAGLQEIAIVRGTDPTDAEFAEIIMAQFAKKPTELVYPDVTSEAITIKGRSQTVARLRGIDCRFGAIIVVCQGRLADQLIQRYAMEANPQDNITDIPLLPASYIVYQTSCGGVTSSPD